jgi:hypothetical protein
LRSVAEEVGVSHGTLATFLNTGRTSEKTLRKARRWLERLEPQPPTAAAGYEWVRQWVEEEAAAARDQARAAYERARAVAHITGGGDVEELRRELRTRGIAREERDREGDTE